MDDKGRRIRLLVHKYLPYLAAHVRSLRVRIMSSAFNRRHGLTSVMKRIEMFSEMRVLEGPFQGMEYINASAGSALGPKILGTYEMELRPIVEKVMSLKPSVILDIGAAEGYYAVGFARRVPEAHVFAFDIDPFARKLCRRLARLNEVHRRVTVCGCCNSANIQQVAKGRTVIVCDCEGFESDLLDPEVAPALRDAWLLVELHEHLVGGVGGVLESRFQKSHDIEKVDTRARKPEDSSFASRLPSQLRHLAIAEFRPAPQQWLWMSPKTNGDVPRKRSH